MVQSGIPGGVTRTRAETTPALCRVAIEIHCINVLFGMLAGLRIGLSCWLVGRASEGEEYLSPLQFI